MFVGMPIFDKNLSMLTAGVFGAGHLGKIHLKLLQQSDQYELKGFYDSDPAMSEKVVADLGYHRFDTPESLIENCDVVVVVTPTLSHFEMAETAIRKGKHVFIEKPITQDLAQAKRLIELADTHGVKGQVGHVERFNPAFTAVKDHIGQPMFIETHRLAEFNPRGTDVPVVLDLMIHDLDIVLSVVRSEVKEIRASAVSVLSKSPDIANARIEFANGCVANLTASRISMKNMRKSRFFQKDAYITVDFLEKKSEVLRMKDAPDAPGPYDLILPTAEGQKKQIYYENPDVKANNAILDELNTFAHAIEGNGTPVVTFRDGAKALELALGIMEAFDN